MTNFDNPRPGQSAKDLLFPRRKKPSSTSSRNRYGHNSYDDAMFTITDPSERIVTLFTRQGDRDPYRIGPLYQQPIRQGFLEHSDSMLSILSAREKQLLLRDLLHAIRVGKGQQTMTDVKRMIGQTINYNAQNAHNSLTPEVVRDTLITEIHVYPTAPPNRRVRSANLAMLIEIAEMMIPHLPHTVETAEQITSTFDHSIGLLSESVNEKAKIRTRPREKARERANERENIVALKQQLASWQSHMLETISL